MEVLYGCCAGLDVHARTVVACLLKDGRKEIRTFSTMTDDLLALSDWLSAAGCTHVAMESTGVYWKPVFNLLEGAVEVLLVNARHVKAVPGRKLMSAIANGWRTCSDTVCSKRVSFRPWRFANCAS